MTYTFQDASFAHLSSVLHGNPAPHIMESICTCTDCCQLNPHGILRTAKQKRTHEQADLANTSALVRRGCGCLQPLGSALRGRGRGTSSSANTSVSRGRGRSLGTHLSGPAQALTIAPKASPSSPARDVITDNGSAYMLPDIEHSGDVHMGDTNDQQMETQCTSPPFYT